jgi:hypothetical protein
MAELGVKARQEVERKIVVQVIKDLHNAGYNITVNDGEEEVLEKSLDQTDVLDAMFSTDEDYLIAVDATTGIRIGYVRLIYGNDGPDVINDYTTNLEHVLATSLNLAEAEDERLFGN